MPIGLHDSCSRAAEAFASTCDGNGFHGSAPCAWRAALASLLADLIPDCIDPSLAGVVLYMLCDGYGTPTLVLRHLLRLWISAGIINGCLKCTSRQSKPDQLLDHCIVRLPRRR